jgi:hypothetical protein
MINVGYAQLTVIEIGGYINFGAENFRPDQNFFDGKIEAPLPSATQKSTLDIRHFCTIKISFMDIRTTFLINKVLPIVFFFCSKFLGIKLVLKYSTKTFSPRR